MAAPPVSVAFTAALATATAAYEAACRAADESDVHAMAASRTAQQAAVEADAAEAVVCAETDVRGWPASGTGDGWASQQQRPAGGGAAAASRGGTQNVDPAQDGFSAAMAAAIASGKARNAALDATAPTFMSSNAAHATAAASAAAVLAAAEDRRAREAAQATAAAAAAAAERRRRETSHDRRKREAATRVAREQEASHYGTATAAAADHMAAAFKAHGPALAASIAASNAHWEAFVAVPSGVVRLQDVPWPDVGVLSNAQALGLEVDVRALQARWHPDRFSQKFGARLAEGDRDAIMARVTSVAASMNTLRQRAGK